jgi:glutamate/tyrosine decarboxylase-like PLP-dependent enzyme
VKGGPGAPGIPGDLFVGVRGEGIPALRALLGRVLDHHRALREAAFRDGPPDPATAGRPDPPAGAAIAEALEALLARLEANAPFFHPRYVAQMIKDPAIPALVGYLAAQLINPNNHAYEGGPATTDMEIEVIRDLLGLVGFEQGGRPAGWGHLCSGGTLANLEALWAARDSRPDGPLVISRVAHYSWKRSAAILRIPRVIEVEVDARLRLDADHLEEILRRERPLMVVANLGSTGTGSVDPIASIATLRDRHGFHLHVDAAYGGYVRACLRGADGSILPAPAAREECGLSEDLQRQIRALGRADSITIDPHKHGLSPYGAGSVLYRDERLKDPLLNTAPYTYHLADRPNLGMITLEGSRPGATAAACWLTHRVLPLTAEGFGAVVGSGLRAARALHRRAAAADRALPLHEPDLDILCLVRLPPDGAPRSIAAINRATEAVYERFRVGAPGRPPVILSRFNVPADIAARAIPGLAADAPTLTALRLVLMKHWLGRADQAGLLEEIGTLVLES